VVTSIAVPTSVGSSVEGGSLPLLSPLEPANDESGVEMSAFDPDGGLPSELGDEQAARASDSEQHRAVAARMGKRYPTCR
jgi:hypothetical protein